MSLFKLFVAGLALTFRKRRLVPRLWVVNFLFAVLVAAPAAFLFIGHSWHSLSAASILKKLDVHWLTDFSSRFLDAAPAYVGLLVLAVGLYMLLAIFLNGGIIGCLARPGSRPTLADFFHDCGLYFWRFFRLFLISIPVYLLALALFFPFLRVLLEALQRRAATGWPALIAGNIRILSLVLFLGLISMFFDYVKIGLATGGRHGVLRESWLTLKFLRRRFFKAWALYLSAGLAFILLTLLYLEIARLLPKDRPLLVLVFFLWQQLYIFGRQASRVLFFATELEFFRQFPSPDEEKIK
jgi:hypothetical protein